MIAFSLIGSISGGALGGIFILVMGIIVTYE